MLSSQAFANDPAFEDLGPCFFGDLLEKAMLPTVGVHADLVIDAATRRAVHAVDDRSGGQGDDTDRRRCADHIGPRAPVRRRGARYGRMDRYVSWP